MNTEKDKINSITIMCDYCADGLWVNGTATNLNDLILELGLNNNTAERNAFLNELGADIDIWQLQYEDFDFWSSQATNAVYDTQKFKDFISFGFDIFKRMHHLIQKNHPEILVEFFDESDSHRYIILDGVLTLKQEDTTNNE